MEIRIISRVVIYNPKKQKLILARNKNAKFWYAPGGGWEYADENILEAAKREVEEEVGIDIEVSRLLYVQEFQESENRKYFETFWLAEYTGEIDTEHIDLDPNGMVEEIREFSKDELSDLKVFPDRLKNTFWENIDNIKDNEDPFIGVS